MDDRIREAIHAFACELARRRMNLAYVRTSEGHEVDFLATAPDGSAQLIQVAAEIGNRDTFEREIRALQGAAAEFPRARKVLIAEGPPPAGIRVPDGIEILRMWRWLLEPTVPTKGTEG
jgi:predicted AAA+ superfamily ATPase